MYDDLFYNYNHGASAAKFLFHVPPTSLRSRAIDLVDANNDQLNMIITFYHNRIYSIYLFNRTKNVLMYELYLYQSNCQPQTVIDALVNKNGELAKYYSSNKSIIFYDHMITYDHKITQFNDIQLQKLINILQ